VNGAVVLVIGLLGLNAYLMWTNPIQKDTVTGKDDKKVTNIHIEGASNFAKNFAATWVQGDLDKVGDFLAIGYNLPKNALDGTKRKVLWAQVVDVEQISDSKINVVVELGVEKDKQPNPEIVYLSVPLLVEPHGRYGVCDLPTYVPEPGRAVFKDEDSSKNTLSSSDQDAIRKKVSFFFQEYLTGSPDSLAHVFDDQQKRSVLKGKLLAILDLKISNYENQTDRAKVKALAQVDIDDVQSLISFNLIVKKHGNQWFIESTDPTIPLYTPSK
jgi:hypothetical protein